MILMQELAYSKQSETVVLGYAISSRDGLQSVSTLLKKEDFHSKQHQSLFHVFQGIYQKGWSLDIHLLCEELKRQKLLAALGGKSYLAYAVELFLNCEHAEECIEEVKRLSLLREMLRPELHSQPNLVTCGSLPDLRYYIFFKTQVFVGKCVERIGRKVLIDLKAFDVSLKDQTKG